jgi:predicted XRE-type DNA-binding protein
LLIVCNALKLNKLLDERGLSQAEASKLLGMPQPKISAIRNYKLQGISLERLLHALTALGQHVEISVSPVRKGSAARISVAA